MGNQGELTVHFGGTMRRGTDIRAGFGLWVMSVAVLGTACAAGTQEGGTRSDADVLTRQEIESADATNALDVIRRLRPAWLRPRMQSRMNEPAQEPVVYVDNMRYGELRSLSELDAQLLREIRYLDAPEATMRYGTGHTGGAILVTTGR